MRPRPSVSTAYGRGVQGDRGAGAAEERGDDELATDCVVGETLRTSDGYTVAFAWRGGVMTDLVPASEEGSALGVNSLGQIVGYFRNPSQPSRRAFLMNAAGGFTDLGGSGREAMDINDAGQIVLRPPPGLWLIDSEPVPHIQTALFKQDGAGAMDDFNDVKVGDRELPCDGFLSHPAIQHPSRAAPGLQLRRLYEPR
jgi:probable HAF family extracellular repeat protein